MYLDVVGRDQHMILSHTKKVCYYEKLAALCLVLCALIVRGWCCSRTRGLQINRTILDILDSHLYTRLQNTMAPITSSPVPIHLNLPGSSIFPFSSTIFQVLRGTIRPFSQVWAEVSLAWNQMGDDAVGRLLQALQRSQLRVRTLKFRGNGIGSAGGPGLGMVPRRGDGWKGCLRGCVGSFCRYWMTRELQWHTVTSLQLFTWEIYGNLRTSCLWSGTLLFDHPTRTQAFAVHSTPQRATIGTDVCQKSTAAGLSQICDFIHEAQFNLRALAYRRLDLTIVPDSFPKRSSGFYHGPRQ